MSPDVKINVQKISAIAGVIIALGGLAIRGEENHSASLVNNALLVKRVDDLEKEVIQIQSYRLQDGAKNGQMDDKLDQLSIQLEILQTKLADCKACR